LTVSRLKLTMSGLTAKGNTMEKSHLHLIKWAIDKGYTLEVWGDGEELDYSGTGYKAAKEATEACDTAEIVLKYKSGKVATWFYVVNGMDEPEEFVSDYGYNEVGRAWEKAYDQACHPEEVRCCNK